MDNTEKYFFVAVIIFIILIKMTFSKKYENFFRYGGSSHQSNSGGFISSLTTANKSYCKKLSEKKCKKSSTCNWNEDLDVCY